MLLVPQRPDAAHVAAHRTWQKFGQQIRMGEKGILIIAPNVAYVFDIGQTDGEPLTEMTLFSSFVFAGPCSPC